MPRRGPRSEGDARQEILDSARASFAENGYDRTTIRGVATAAGVDPALVHHYFGTKEELFTSSVSVPISLATALPNLISDDADRAGEAIARLFFSVWEEPKARAALLGQLRHALATGKQPAIAGFIAGAVLGRVAERMTGEDRELRAELIASHLLGVAILRYVVRLEPIASVEPEQIIALVAPRIQTYLS
ncbi:MAG TPA: TetR family transcriptional regulator [Acidimicrobiia bacterium]|nr:TetR family transcriptional regulator [Acidimicrobiia bacterium]